MNYNQLQQQIALTLLSGIGPIKAKELLKRVENIDDLFLNNDKTLATVLDVSINAVAKLNRVEALNKASEVVDFIIQKGIQPIYFKSDLYPRRLKNCNDSPLMLYGIGDFDLNPLKAVAVVGTRNATAYGKQLCEELIEEIKGNDTIVVSGLAHGIDACIHRACVDTNQSTIGVLGHGLDRIYPASHKSLAHKMLSHGGLITEFIPGTTPDRENFPKRNRIVAGLCDATIVIESKVKGGSLITANLANDYNRDVFAYPGSVHKETSQGCNALIAQQKAHLIQSPSDFLKLMNWEEAKMPKAIQKSMFPLLTEIQSKITALIASDTPIQIDILSLKTNLPISVLNPELFNLEMSGVIQSLPGKKYCMA